MPLISGGTGHHRDSSVSPFSQNPSAWQSLGGFWHSPATEPNTDRADRFMRNPLVPPGAFSQPGALWLCWWEQWESREACSAFPGSSILGQPPMAAVPERCPGQPRTQIPQGFHRYFPLLLLGVYKHQSYGGVLGFGAFSLKHEERECCFFTTSTTTLGKNTLEGK